MTELVEDEYERFPNDKELQAEYAIRKPILSERKNQIFDLIDHEPENVKLVTEASQDALRTLKQAEPLRVQPWHQSPSFELLPW